jgi:hypothetical protein
MSTPDPEYTVEVDHDFEPFVEGEENDTDEEATDA